MKLTEFSIDKQGIVVEVKDNPVALKLAEYGITPGAKFRILTKASFNGPIFIQVGSNKIALRSEEASSIIVE